MSQGDQLVFQDDSKVDRLVGTLHDQQATVGHVLTVQADQSIAAAAGGGGGSVEGGYSGNPVAVADGTVERLTWDVLANGTDLLDRSTANLPTFIADGTYAVTILVSGDALTVNGYATVVATVTPFFGTGAETQHPGNTWSVAGVLIASAGDTLSVSVTNNDGVSSRNFNIAAAIVVKLA
jgi:hypothetical protein